MLGLTLRINLSLFLLIVLGTVSLLTLASCSQDSAEATFAPAKDGALKDEGPLPVIFIAGVQGSMLAATKDGTILWPPGGLEADVGFSSIPLIRENFFRLSLNPATQPHEEIYAPDIIRRWGQDGFYDGFISFLTGKGYVEYRVDGNPARRTTRGAFTRQEPKPLLFVFAYDWRLPIEENAHHLAEYVEVVNRIHPNKDVNIVAHSMGGLVARRYIVDHPDKVNKLITIAAPFLGSAKPLYQMIYGKLSAPVSYGFEASKSAISDVLTGGTTSPFAEGPIREMLLYFPGVHDLMLSESYYSLGGSPFTEQLATPLGLPLEINVSFADLMGPNGKVDQLFPNPARVGTSLRTPASINRDFHAYTANGNNQDDWSRDTTGVQYYHIIGVQNSADTPLSINAVLPDSVYPQFRDYAIQPFGPGDGTVPLLSAARIGNGRNLNAPNARLFIYTVGTLARCGGSLCVSTPVDTAKEIVEHPAVTVYSSRNSDPTLEHTGIMSNPMVWDKVLELLGEAKNEPTATAEPIVMASPTRASPTQTASPTPVPTGTSTPRPLSTPVPTPTRAPAPTLALSPTPRPTSTPTMFKYVLKEVRVNPRNGSLSGPSPEPRGAGSFTKATVGATALAWQSKNVWDGQVVWDYTFTFNVGTVPKELVIGQPSVFTAQGNVSGTQASGFPLGEFFFQFGQRGETAGIGLYPYDSSKSKSGSAKATYILPASQSSLTVTLTAIARPCTSACVIEWVYERQSP